MKKLLYVGLDVHKETISAAVAAKGEEEVRYIGTIVNNSATLQRLIRKIKSSAIYFVPADLQNEPRMSCDRNF